MSETDAVAAARAEVDEAVGAYAHAMAPPQYHGQYAAIVTARAKYVAALDVLEAEVRLAEAAACRDAMVDMPVEAFALCAKRVIEAEAVLAARRGERKEA